MKKFLCIGFCLISPWALASNNEITTNSQLILCLCIMLGLASLALLVNKVKQPSVLGQILAGIIISILAHYNFSPFKLMPQNSTLAFLAELGSIFLLFEIGLESSIKEISQAGKPASIVAIIGVLLPFILGYFIVTPFLFKVKSNSLALFISSMLAVTSTGISISVFKELGMLKNQACQIVLGASIIDDIIGLILLSIVSGLALSGGINYIAIGFTLLKVSLFFMLSILLSFLIFPKLNKYLWQKISLSYDMLILVLITFGLFMAWLAHTMGLASIIGAFVAGLLIDETCFKGYVIPPHKSTFILDNKLSQAISPLGTVLIPIFFIYAGMQVDVITALNWTTIKLAIIITGFAIIGKIFCGILLPSQINKWIVGFGMLPRGEIGIIFALAGLKLKIIDNDTFAALLLMIVITSLVTPLTLTWLSKRLN